MTMQTPANRFKQALREKRPQIGLWQSFASSYTAEICATAGFDWLLLDGEHSPNDIQTLLAQAQAIAAYPDTHPVARLPMGHGHVGQMLAKQYLDLGLQTILVPMVDTAEQAREIVRGTRYPPDGVRGVATARAARWGLYADYHRRANEEVCLLLQIETVQAMQNLDAIAATDGVDGIFIGPSDLSAAMGHLGNAAHPDVQRTIEDAIARIQRAGKAAGILIQDEALARRYLELGALFVAVGTDSGLLSKAARALISRFR